MNKVIRLSKYSNVIKISNCCVFDIIIILKGCNEFESCIYRENEPIIYKKSNGKFMAWNIVKNSNNSINYYISIKSKNNCNVNMEIISSKKSSYVKDLILVLSHK